MYRTAAGGCVECGGFVSAQDGDICDGGLRCWHCTTAAEVHALQEDVRARLPRWERWVGRVALTTYCVASLCIGAITGIFEPLLGFALLGVSATALYFFVRGSWPLGLAIAGCELVWFTWRMHGDSTSPLLPVVFALLALGRRGLTLRS